ncbi:polysaccharide pyruvyl transferase family protein [Flammeovirga sp. EKP202]|uniref:polysaccharide pyruvyl transferase family protein n=1 Tax=Flammeovirga sp. EKP202 TaxID=2770592 RepID=UPI00165F6CAC|nr:polysaccharide pyruvyl transferase family protein [Flammeovirga sp. EKP202]MBD0399846.1 polysaccharide pyruvyl transferase family protein [Flammeovirga sp. EKP202]
MKKIFLISDNRDDSNWGCRATSAALTDIIKKSISNQDVEFDTVGLKDIHFYQPYYHFKNIPLFDRIYNFYPGHSNVRWKKNIKRLLAVIFSPLFKPFFYKDSVPHKATEVNTFVKLVKNKKILQKEVNAIMNADLVICNGEGSVYADERKGKYNLFLLYIAKTLFNKKVYMINHMFDPKSNDLIELSKFYYPHFDEIVFRDELSLKYFNDLNLNLKVSFLPDAAFIYHSSKSAFITEISIHNKGYLDVFSGNKNYWENVDLSKDFVIIGGSSRLTKPGLPKGYNPILSFQLLIDELQRKGIQVVLSEPCLGDNFMRLLSSKNQLPILPVETPTQMAIDIMSLSKCYISGRYHPMILTMVSGTPVVAFTSNSHKTRSLQDFMGFENEPNFAVEYLDTEYVKVAEYVEYLISVEPVLRPKIKKKVDNIQKSILDFYSNILT